VDDGDVALQGLYEEVEPFEEELEKLNDQENKEVLEVAKKYYSLRKPVLDKRNAVLSKIPRFWITAFVNHPLLRQIVNEKDLEILEHLRDLVVEEQLEGEKLGHKILMHFDKNQFFSNAVLWKEFQYNVDKELVVTCSEIKWGVGKEPKPIPEPKQGKRKKEEFEEPSFFENWFSPEDQDDDLGDIIKEDLWQNPVKYFHGLDDFDGDDEDDEGGEEDDEAIEVEEAGDE